MGLSLRANLLRWATLTPDLGVEWRISPSWGIAVNGSWTSWSWSDKDRRYALWEVAPEVRYYMGAQRRGYLGAMFKAGAFNYKLSETGRQGDLVGGGLTGGYILPLGKRLAFGLLARAGLSACRLREIPRHRRRARASGIRDPQLVGDPSMPASP